MVNQYFLFSWSWYVATLNIHTWTFKESSKLNAFWSSPTELRLELFWMFKAEYLLYIFWMFTCQLGRENEIFKLRQFSWTSHVSSLSCLFKCPMEPASATVSSHIIMVTACSYHVTYAFQSESTLCSYLNVKELLARNRHEIWRLSDCNRTWTHNHLFCK